MSNSSYEDDNMYNIPDDVSELLHVVYHCIYPVIIILGLISNVLCLIVATRKNLQKNNITRYLKFAFSIDLFGNILTIPTVAIEGCTYSSYAEAVYYAHFGWSAITTLRILTHYTLMWISYDRFLAVWYPNRYKKINTAIIVKKRLIIMTILISILYIPFDSMAEVRCIKGSPEGSGCTVWLSMPVYKVMSNEEKYTLFKPIKVICALVFSVIPGLLIVFFSVALGYGLVKKEKSTKMSRTIETNYYRIITVLVLNISCLMISSPLQLLYSNYILGSSHCYMGFGMEAAIALLNSLLSLWSAVNGLVVIYINKDYLNELVHIFKPKITVHTPGKL
ncbi:unnamed protein product [Meganyctiphanes norvegica]|uniref:G-protein coupled receptors family 1 profile domain-containing protein n=1 Tax=Meganyctiphanes norvegica TaxID=48144 RepID=A0AAV2SZ33_MEGNR